MPTYRAMVVAADATLAPVDKTEALMTKESP